MFPHPVHLRRLRPACRGRGAFTLLELLVSMTVLVAIMIMTMTALGGINNLWAHNRARISTFQESRAAFEFLTREIAQATLNTYWDYNSRTAPTHYVRASELHFIVDQGATLLGGNTHPTQAIFFQQPAGYTENRGQTPGGLNDTPLRSMLCASGFYLQYGPTPGLPAFLSGQSRSRTRLFRFLEPGERLSVYADPSGSSWASAPVAQNSSILAENVIGLILRVRYPGPSGETTSYHYDSRDEGSPLTHHQLPPVICVTMVVIDEASAVRLGADYRDTDPPAGDGVPFTVAAKYEDDLNQWRTHLQSLNINYRVFTAELPIRGAKWSSQ